MRIKVQACGVCRTDLHIVDGELPHHKLPLILGHQIVGVVDEVGAGRRRRSASATSVGSALAGLDRRHVAATGCPGWTGLPMPGRENLCDHAKFTGYDIDGGFAEYAVADHRYAFPIPAGYPVPQAAPLLCAGLIGYRSLSMTGDAERLGLYGYGAAAHIVTQVARHQGRRVFAFTRPGDTRPPRSSPGRWGPSGPATPPRTRPEQLDAAIIFAPAGDLVPLALRAVGKGGSRGVRRHPHERHPLVPVRDLWGERTIRSVANLTGGTAGVPGAGAARSRCRPRWNLFPLEQANEALERLRSGRIRGAAVLVIDADRKGVGACLIRPLVSYSIERVEVLKEDGTVDEALMPALSPEDIKRLYAHMVLTRQFDERMFKLQRQGRLGTFARVAGQEGAHVGAAFALRPDDWLVPGFPGDGRAALRGLTMEQLLQFWGGDERGGKFPQELRTLPVAIPVGTHMLHAVGIAWAMKPPARTRRC